ITAKELLDISADRIESRFASAPDTKITLLGVTADIYRELNEMEHYGRLHQQQMQLARARYGEASAVVIPGLLDQAGIAGNQGRNADALARLDRIDPLIHNAGLDRSIYRARWWYRRGDALVADARTQGAAREALERAAPLFAQFAPQDPGYAVTMQLLCLVQYGAGDYQAADAYIRQAIAIAEGQQEPPAGTLISMYEALGVTSTSLEDYAAAD